MTSEFYKVSHNRLVQQVLTKAKYDMLWSNNAMGQGPIRDSCQFDIVIPIRL